MYFQTLNYLIKQNEHTIKSAHNQNMFEILFLLFSLTNHTVRSKPAFCSCKNILHMILLLIT